MKKNTQESGIMASDTKKVENPNKYVVMVYLKSNVYSFNKKQVINNEVFCCYANTKLELVPNPQFMMENESKRIANYCKAKYNPEKYTFKSSFNFR